MKWLKSFVEFLKIIFKSEDGKTPVTKPAPGQPEGSESSPNQETTGANSQGVENSEKIGLFADISRYEPCTFSKFKGKFLIFKGTDGGTWVDPTMTNNINECFARGINYGVYHFYRTGTDPIAQAKHFILKVGLKNLKDCYFDPILDFETVSNPKVGQVQDWKMLKNDVKDAMKFLDYIYEQTGRKCIFYTYESLLESLELSADFRDKCSKLWIAKYSTKKPTKFAPWTKPWAWQYSDGEFSSSPAFKDSFEGIGRCDANILWDEI